MNSTAQQTLIALALECASVVEANGGEIEVDHRSLIDLLTTYGSRSASRRGRRSARSTGSVDFVPVWSETASHPGKIEYEQTATLAIKHFIASLPSGVRRGLHDILSSEVIREAVRLQPKTGSRFTYGWKTSLTGGALSTLLGIVAGYFDLQAGQLLRLLTMPQPVSSPLFDPSSDLMKRLAESLRESNVPAIREHANKMDVAASLALFFLIAPLFRQLKSMGDWRLLQNVAALFHYMGGATPEDVLLMDSVELERKLQKRLAEYEATIRKNLANRTEELQKELAEYEKGLRKKLTVRVLKFREAASLLMADLADVIWERSRDSEKRFRRNLIYVGVPETTIDDLIIELRMSHCPTAYLGKQPDILDVFARVCHSVSDDPDIDMANAWAASLHETDEAQRKWLKSLSVKDRVQLEATRSLVKFMLARRAKSPRGKKSAKLTNAVATWPPSVRKALTLPKKLVELTDDNHARVMECLRGVDVEAAPSLVIWAREKLVKAFQGSAGKRVQTYVMEMPKKSGGRLTDVQTVVGNVFNTINAVELMDAVVRAYSLPGVSGFGWSLSPTTYRLQFSRQA